MVQDPSDWFAASVAQLNDPQNLRVWSIIVSLFGDLAQKPGDRISGHCLTRIITPMGIKPEAMRVALHRLRKDGWIESNRAGRASVHFLTEYGREQSAAVTPRIYERTAQEPRDWHLLIADEANGQATLEDLKLLPNYISVNRHTALGHGMMPRNLDDLMVLQASDIAVPDWLKRRLFPAELMDSCRTLQQALAAIGLPPAGLDPLDIACLRTLIVHHWRRIVLRHPGLPPLFHPSNWQGEACRAQVVALLDALPRPEAARLAETSDG